MFSQLNAEIARQRSVDIAAAAERRRERGSFLRRRPASEDQTPSRRHSLRLRAPRPAVRPA